MESQIIAQRANAAIPAITNASTEPTEFTALPESGTPVLLDVGVDVPDSEVLSLDFLVVVGAFVLDGSWLPLVVVVVWLVGFVVVWWVVVVL